MENWEIEIMFSELIGEAFRIIFKLKVQHYGVMGYPVCNFSHQENNVGLNADAKCLLP